MISLQVAEQESPGCSRICAECAFADCRLRSFVETPVVPSKRPLLRGDRLECKSAAGCLQFWIIVRGLAAICTSFADGRRQILALERSGDLICGLMAGVETPTWIEALSDCEICSLDLTPSGAKLRDQPAFLDRMFRTAHERLARTQAHLATLGRLDSRERVTLFLAEMASHSDQPRVSLSLSREDIADYLGLNAETVSRILSKLKKSGLVVFLSPTEYVLPDLSAIQRRLPVPVPMRVADERRMA